MVQKLLSHDPGLAVLAPTAMQSTQATCNSEAILAGCDIAESIQHWEQQPQYLELLQDGMYVCHFMSVLDASQSPLIIFAAKPK